MNTTINETTDDPWALWRAAKDNPDIRSRYGLTTDGEWVQGYYRIRWKGRLEPIIYWKDQDGWHCKIRGQWFDENYDRHMQVAAQQFIAAWKNPVAEEDYDKVLAGGEWPDLDAVVAEHISRERIGGNNPPPDEAATLELEIEKAAAAAAKYKKITDPATNSAAQTARALLNELGRRADARREAATKPHWDAYKLAQKLWDPLVKRAKEAAESIRLAMNEFETIEARRIERERREAEAVQRRQLEEEQRAADAAIVSGLPQAPELPPMTPPPPAPRTRVKGGFGRAASIRVVRRAKVTDQDAFYAQTKDDDNVREFFKDLATKLVKEGHSPAGITITEEREVR